MQLVLIVLTKTKEMIHYCESFGYGGTMLSNIIANDLTHVSVPVENGQIIPIMGISHHPHHMGISLHPPFGHFTSCPTTKHKQPNNLINRKESICKS
jgi:hypothetical protein